MPSHLEEEIAEGQAMLADCPAFVGHDRTARCECVRHAVVHGASAQITSRSCIRPALACSG